MGIHFGGQKSAAPEQRERIRRWTHAVHDPSRVDAGPRAYHYLPLGKGISARKPPQRNYPWYDEGREAAACALATLVIGQDSDSLRRSSLATSIFRSLY